MFEKIVNLIKKKIFYTVLDSVSQSTKHQVSDTKQMLQSVTFLNVYLRTDTLNHFTVVLEQTVQQYIFRSSTRNARICTDTDISRPIILIMWKFLRILSIKRKKNKYKISYTYLWNCGSRNDYRRQFAYKMNVSSIRSPKSNGQLSISSNAYIQTQQTTCCLIHRPHIKPKLFEYLFYILVQIAKPILKAPENATLYCIIVRLLCPYK